MANFHPIQISDGSANWNGIYHYGNAVYAILNAGDRRGPVRISFAKEYDVRFFVSEKFQDPS
jgi:hypothetical protein